MRSILPLECHGHGSTSWFNLHMICETYLDDYIVYRYRNDEFVSRLETAFVSFSKHKLYFKAGKCSFGFREFELVGKVVSV